MPRIIFRLLALFLCMLIVACNGQASSVNDETTVNRPKPTVVSKEELANELTALDFEKIGEDIRTSDSAFGYEIWRRESDKTSVELSDRAETGILLVSQIGRDGTGEWQSIWCNLTVDLTDIESRPREAIKQFDHLYRAIHAGEYAAVPAEPSEPGFFKFTPNLTEVMECYGTKRQ